MVSHLKTPGKIWSDVGLSAVDQTAPYYSNSGYWNGTVCMIGGFDKFHFFTGCTEEETRREVCWCFEEAGTNGGFILSPSDHFFEADLKLIKAFADEAKQCRY